MSGEYFDWTTIEDDIVVPQQAQIAIYNNQNGGIVCRQAGQYGPDEDSWIFFHPNHALAIAKAILDRSGLTDLVIVHASQLLVQNGGGELLQPFPDRATMDAVDRAGREDDDQPAEHEAKKDRTAAERQRRRREKQRERDGVGAERDISVTERDSDRDSVTTAPALPELDFQGGQQAHAH